MNSKIAEADLSANDLRFGLLRRVKRHPNFVSDGILVSCYRPTELLETDADACRYIRATDWCSYGVKSINYLEFLVCDMKEKVKFDYLLKSLIIIMILTIVYGMFMYIICAYRIVPNLITVFNHVDLQPQDYGLITALFLIMPEFIHDLNKCRLTRERDSIMLSKSIGKVCNSLFFCPMIMATAGPVVIPRGFFLRNMIIALVAYMYIYYSINDEEVEMNAEREINPLVVPSTVLMIFYVSYLIVTIIVSCVIVKRARAPDEPPPSPHPSRLVQVAFELKNIKSDEYLPATPPDTSINAWLLFAQSLNPCPVIQKWSLFAQMLGIPMWIISVLLVPIIDESQTLSGWIKHTTCISFLLYPLVMWMMKIFNWIFICYAMAFCSALVLLVLLMTDMRRLPKYHVWISCAGLIIGWTMFHIIQLELQSLGWQAFNYFLDWHSDAIAVVVLPLSYSYAEYVLSRHLIMRGYSDIAYGLAMGLTMSATFVMLPSITLDNCNQLDIVTRQQVPIASITMIAIVYIYVVFVLTLFAVPVMDYEIRQSFSICMLISYIVYLVKVDSCANDLIHGYNGVHSVTNLTDQKHVSWA